MGNTNHKTYVQVQGPYFVAACEECGTAGFPTRDKIENAEADASAHGAFEHLTDRDQLIKDAAAARV